MFDKKHDKSIDTDLQFSALISTQCHGEPPGHFIQILLAQYRGWQLPRIQPTASQGHLPWSANDWSRGAPKNPLPPGEHQNSWDLWMVIPLKMVLIGIDPYPNMKHDSKWKTTWGFRNRTLTSRNLQTETTMAFMGASVRWSRWADCKISNTSVEMSTLRRDGKSIRNAPGVAWRKNCTPDSWTTGRFIWFMT